MTRISDLEDEGRYRNDLGRENRTAIKRSIIVALMAIGALAVAVLLAPLGHSTKVGGDASGSHGAAVATAAALEPAIGGSLFPQHITLAGETVEIGYY